MEEVSDSRIAGMLRRYISSNLKYDRDPRLKGIKLCGSRILPAPGGDGRVYVAVNDVSAHFKGLASCHSPWACPICSAKVMAKKGAEIAALIEAKKQLYHEYAFMLTFTLPHTEQMSCYQTDTVLEKTWRKFTGTYGKSKRKYHVYGTFRDTFNITSIVRVYEFTWGYNGWHPHIHALLWTAKENFPKLAEWEDKLTAQWFKCARSTHEKLIKDEKNNPDVKPVDLDDMYSERNLKPKTGHRAVFFSKDSRGQVVVQKSSHYISGWSADKELSTQKIAHHNGHYSPQEMLQKAYDAKDDHTRNFWLDLYLEYAITTRGHRRVNFTPKDRNITKDWISREGFITMLKKRITDKVGETRAVFWFDKLQWHAILISEYTYRRDLRSEILEAALKDPPSIVSLLKSIDIDVSHNDLNDKGINHVNKVYAESCVAG